MLKSPKEDIAKDLLLKQQKAVASIKAAIIKCASNGVDPTKEISKAIVEYCKEIKDPIEKEKERKALVASARKWQYEYVQTCKILGQKMWSRLLQSNPNLRGYSIDPIQLITGAPGKDIEAVRPYLEATHHVITPVIEEYRNKYKQAISALSAEPPKVVDLSDGKAYTMSLRNRAEMKVRYEANMEDLQQFRNNMENGGTKLVWISTHPNCSPRCKDYQGKLYSLDGSSGTIDGIKYQPIEVALRGPKGDGNGCIDGYNCRHRTIPYTKGSKPPSDYTDAEIKKEYSIDQRQRAYENNIRQMKMQERLLRATGNKEDLQEAKRLRKKWQDATARYQAYSIEQGRAFYRWRCAIEPEENS